MANKFREEIDARLSDLTFTGQAEVLARVRKAQSARPTVRPLPKRTLALVLALMLMLCGTAVALTLRYSARLDHERYARGVLSSKYGLTGDMMDLFHPVVEEDENGWRVSLIAIGWKEQMGEYTVTSGADGSVQATWSYDGAEPSDSIWGAEKIQQFIDAKKVQHDAEAKAGNRSALSLEEQAAIDASVMELGIYHWVSIVPGEEDIQQEEAERMARQAIMDKYGVSEEELSGCSMTIRFLLYPEDGRKEYRIYLSNYDQIGSFDVALSSPDGESDIIWYPMTKSAWLPKGNLAQYPDAAKRFVQAGVFEQLSAEEKADVYRRFTEAGLTGLLPDGEYVTPAVADLNEQAAIAKAKEAMIAQYEFPEEGFEHFSVRTAMLRMDGGRVWQVRFTGKYHNLHLWFDEDTLGEYTVSVAADGSVAGCEWSLDDKREVSLPEGYTGYAEVFTGDDLANAIKLIGKLNQITDKYPGLDYVEDMSLEDRAAFDALMRQAGFNPRTYNCMLPQKGDMPQEEAYELARQVLKDEYGLTDEVLDSSHQEINFWMRYDLGDAPIRGWYFDFQGAEIYGVFVNAEEGVIEMIYHDDLTLGNG